MFDETVESILSLGCNKDGDAMITTSRTRLSKEKSDHYRDGFAGGYGILASPGATIGFAIESFEKISRMPEGEKDANIKGLCDGLSYSILRYEKAYQLMRAARDGYPNIDKGILAVWQEEANRIWANIPAAGQPKALLDPYDRIIVLKAKCDAVADILGVKRPTFLPPATEESL